MFEGTVFERTEKDILRRNVIRSNENNVSLTHYKLKCSQTTADFVSVETKKLKKLN